jgi:hypothetical protein
MIPQMLLAVGKAPSRAAPERGSRLCQYSQMQWIGERPIRSTRVLQLEAVEMRLKKEGSSVS